MKKPHFSPKAHDTPEALQRRARLALMAAEVATRAMEDGADPNARNSWDDAPVSAGRRSTATADDFRTSFMMNAGSVSTRYLGTQATADRWGFAGFGDFLATVRTTERGDGPSQIRAIERLRNAASTYGSESFGADGGYAVPPDFREQIAIKTESDDSLLTYCDRLPISGNSLTTPKDETPPWSVTGVSAGIKAYWTPEAGTMPQSKPALEESTHKLHKLTALVPVTDELLEDAPAMGAYVTSKAGDVFTMKMNNVILSGTGNGQPLGILNSGHLVTVSKEGSQVADTIHGLNLVKMWSRMVPGWRRNAVWCINPDAVPALMSSGLQIKSADGTSVVGGSLLYIPGNVSGKPYDTLMGRPVLYLQDCATLGDVGDIVFADFTQYGLIERAGGMRADSSIHVWFDQGITAFRFVYRVDGHPWWSTPLADKNGSTTRSAFIALEAR